MPRCGATGGRAGAGSGGGAGLLPTGESARREARGTREGGVAGPQGIWAGRVIGGEGELRWRRAPRARGLSGGRTQLPCGCDSVFDAQRVLDPALAAFGRFPRGPEGEAARSGGGSASESPCSAGGGAHPAKATGGRVLLPLECEACAASPDPVCTALPACGTCGSGPLFLASCLPARSMPRMRRRR